MSSSNDIQGQIFTGFDNNAWPFILVFKSCYLESVGKDNVRVHGTHIKMVDQRVLQSCRCVSQTCQLVFDLGTNLSGPKNQIMILYLNIDTVSKYHLVIIYFTLMTLMFDSGVILQGEIRCLSLSGVKWSKELLLLVIISFILMIVRYIVGRT